MMFKRSLALWTVLSLATWAQAQSLGIKRWQSYEVARPVLLQRGWVPADSVPNVDAFAEERGEPMRQAGWLEAEACVGADVNLCYFNFKKQNAKKATVCLRVETYGDFLQGAYSPAVFKAVTGPCDKVQARLDTLSMGAWDALGRIRPPKLRAAKSPPPARAEDD